MNLCLIKIVGVLYEMVQKETTLLEFSNGL